MSLVKQATFSTAYFFVWRHLVNQVLDVLRVWQDLDATEPWFWEHVSVFYFVTEKYFLIHLFSVQSSTDIVFLLNSFLERPLSFVLSNLFFILGRLDSSGQSFLALRSAKGWSGSIRSHWTCWSLAWINWVQLLCYHFSNFYCWRVCAVEPYHVLTSWGRLFLYNIFWDRLQF